MLKLTLDMALLLVVDAFFLVFDLSRATRKSMHYAYVAPRSQQSDLTPVMFNNIII